MGLADRQAWKPHERKKEWSRPSRIARFAGSESSPEGGKSGFFELEQGGWRCLLTDLFGPALVERRGGVKGVCMAPGGMVPPKRKT